MRVVFILVCHGLLASSSPLVQTDVKTELEDTSAPDLTSMLNVLKGGSEINTLVDFLRDIEKGLHVFRGLVDHSPLVKDIVESAAHRNIRLKLLLKTVNGQVPDMRDIYDLATAKTNSISHDLMTAANNNDKFKKILKLAVEMRTGSDHHQENGLTAENQGLVREVVNARQQLNTILTAHARTITLDVGAFLSQIFTILFGMLSSLLSGFTIQLPPINLG